MTTITLVDVRFPVIIDLTLVVVVDDRATCHTVVVGVVCAREFAVDLKLSEGILPFLPQVVQTRFSYITDNVESLDIAEHGCHDSLSGLADCSMYSTFLTTSPGSVLFTRSNLLKRKDLFVTFVT
jgi:hypothetical protein